MTYTKKKKLLSRIKIKARCPEIVIEIGTNLSRPNLRLTFFISFFFIVIRFFHRTVVPFFPFFFLCMNVLSIKLTVCIEGACCRHDSNKLHDAQNHRLKGQEIYQYISTYIKLKLYQTQ